MSQRSPSRVDPTVLNSENDKTQGKGQGSDEKGQYQVL